MCISKQPTTTELKSMVKRRIADLQSFSKDKWNIDIEYNLSYDLDSVNTLGMFVPKTKTMRLNIKLLKEYRKLYIDDVVVHEFAHMVVRALYPTRMNGYRKVTDHGREFKAVCSWFGIDGKATTPLFNDSKTMKKSKPSNTFTYSCSCENRTHELSKIRHNKIRYGKASYRCSICKEDLVKD